MCFLVQRNSQKSSFKQILGIEKAHRNSIKITVDFVVGLQGLEPRTDRL